MCAIGGAVNCGYLRLLHAMNGVLSHRGPDDVGTWERSTQNGGWVGLASRRLAIQDLSPRGHMPMSTPDGRLTITFNGEIYNYPQLRSELERKGYRFFSNSDTECLLYLYLEHGPTFVTRLNGMFAFALWDEAEQRLVLARDHFGVKPLYYWHAGDQLVFASEIKAILEHRDIPRAMSLAALNQYLTFLWTPDPLTMFEGILKLPAGHIAIYAEGRLALQPYWDLSLPAHDHVFTATEAQLADEVGVRFGEAVRMQMLSDVPVGAFLSAGLDSSSIVAMMARSTSEAIPTFTITFPPERRQGEVTLDNPLTARRTADRFGCKHTEIVVEPDVVDLLPRLTWYMDEPTADPALIMAYLVCKEAKKDVTVLLSGVGGDEVFAGYRKYQAHFMAERYQRLPEWLRSRVIAPAVQRLPVLRETRFKALIRLAKKFVRSASLSETERFLDTSVYVSEALKHTLLEPSVMPSTAYARAFDRHRDYFQRAAHADFLNQMLYLDLKTFMVSLNLTYTDKMSMACSVETRVPFIDWTLVEWVFNHVPPGLKIKRGVTKHILRQAMAHVLPAEVLTQKKAGFGAPIDRWLAEDLSEMVDDHLSEARLRRRGLFNPEVVRTMVMEQRSGRQEWAMQLWQLLTLELWQHQFLD
jgi:asparagine synthase (glutamine-hydrolysing)